MIIFSNGTFLGRILLSSVLFMYILGTSTVVYVTIWDVRPTRKTIINDTGLQQNPFFVNVVMA